MEDVEVITKNRVYLFYDYLMEYDFQKTSVVKALSLLLSSNAKMKSTDGPN